MSITAEIEIDLDDIADQVRENIEGGSFADDIADQVRENLDIGEIATEVIGSYEFDGAVDEKIDDAVNSALEGVADTIDALTARVATLEAVLATASLALAEPARRALL